jgi:hypothetical protein
MFHSNLARAMVVVFALAVLAFTASGVPDNRGTDAAVGWWSFVALTLILLVQAGTALRRGLRARGHQHDRAPRSPAAHRPHTETHEGERR